MLCLCCIFHHKDHKGYSVLWCVMYVTCIKTSGCLQSKDSLLSRANTVGVGLMLINVTAWQLLQLAAEKAWSVLHGPLFYFLVQTSYAHAYKI